MEVVAQYLGVLEQEEQDMRVAETVELMGQTVMAEAEVVHHRLMGVLSRLAVVEVPLETLLLQRQLLAQVVDKEEQDWLVAVEVEHQPLVLLQLAEQAAQEAQARLQQLEQVVILV